MIRSGKFRNMLSRATCWPGSGTKICPFGVYGYGNRTPRVSRDFRLNSKIKCNLKESLGSLNDEMKNSLSLVFCVKLTFDTFMNIIDVFFQVMRLRKRLLTKNTFRIFFAFMHTSMVPSEY